MEQDPNDGSFFMKWDDYCKYFGEMTVCMVNPTFVHTSFRMMNNKRKSNYVELKIPAKGVYNIFICQESSRKFASRNYMCAEARIIILKKNEKGPMTFVGAYNIYNHQCFSVQAEFEKGSYIVSAKVKWERWTDRECYLVAYGIERVGF